MLTTSSRSSVRSSSRACRYRNSCPQRGLRLRRSETVTSAAGGMAPPSSPNRRRAGRPTSLRPPEMTVLLGGLRVLGANHGQSPLGEFTSTPGRLTNEFFVNLLDVDTEWAPRADNVAGTPTYEGRDRDTGEVKGIASRVDL